MLNDPDNRIMGVTSGAAGGGMTLRLYVATTLLAQHFNLPRTPLHSEPDAELLRHIFEWADALIAASDEEE